MKTAYVALFTPQESDSGYYASVPDLEGCATTGANLPDAIEQIRDAMSVYLLSLEDDHLPFPTPSLPNSVAHAPSDFVAFVGYGVVQTVRVPTVEPSQKFEFSGNGCEFFAVTRDCKYGCFVGSVHCSILTCIL